MAIVLLGDLKAHLAFTSDMDEDDALLDQKIDAAQGHIEQLLEFKIEETFIDAVPPSLQEAVLQLAAHWYEHREGVTESLYELPYGVSAIINEYREFTF